MHHDCENGRPVVDFEAWSESSFDPTPALPLASTYSRCSPVVHISSDSFRSLSWPDPQISALQPHGACLRATNPSQVAEGQLELSDICRIDTMFHPRDRGRWFTVPPTRGSCRKSNAPRVSRHACVWMGVKRGGEHDPCVVDSYQKDRPIVFLSRCPKEETRRIRCCVREFNQAAVAATLHQAAPYRALLPSCAFHLHRCPPAAVAFPAFRLLWGASS